jgi:hypothetical protein
MGIFLGMGAQPDKIPGCGFKKAAPCRYNILGVLFYGEETMSGQRSALSDQLHKQLNLKADG